MLECYTLLVGAGAARPRTVRLGALVTGNTYRNPTLLAKTVTALDIVSGGRAQLGIGAGWFELEHDVARLRVRHVHRPLREARGGAADHPADAARRAPDARRASTTRSTDAINQPPPVGRIPVMIGGAGEKKTLRMVAQYADESNLICDRRRDPPQARRPGRRTASGSVATGREITVSWPARRRASPRPTSRPRPIWPRSWRRGASTGRRSVSRRRSASATWSPWAIPTRWASATPTTSTSSASTGSPEPAGQRPHPGPVELLGQTLSKLF